MSRRKMLGWIAATSVLFAGPAAADESQPLCPHNLPKCVISNWGQIEPDSLDAAATTAGRPHAARSHARLAMTTQATPTAVSAPRATTPLATAEAPAGRLGRGTGALIRAIYHARFDRKGAIVAGVAPIAKAADQLALQAGGKYVLTLSVKAPGELDADDAASLDRKVQSVNALLMQPRNFAPGS